MLREICSLLWLFYHAFWTVGVVQILIIVPLSFSKSALMDRIVLRSHHFLLRQLDRILPFVWVVVLVNI